ncbi:hypothetical protein [Streptomyces sp. V1I1]|uniref:hypothetical protein n=1 Tax=Streptomyces sp. V1I1 TaxID=3042272 RepID=UPI00278235C5|nr:hypothetical protein [Streptomyces sp. V1I1]MDQ0942324.1 hypothetical protein [Streptomyces sp. V1I1]
MRNDFTPQVETVEISDSELDNISGGIASAGADVAGRGAAVSVGDVVGTVQSLAPALPVSQLSSLVTVQTAGI